MRALLILLVLLASTVALECPAEYQLIEGRCIRSIFLSQYDSLAKLTPSSRNICLKDGARLPVILTAEDEAAFDAIAISLLSSVDFLVLDLMCNTTARRVSWGDGTPLTYGPVYNVLGETDCVEWELWAASEPRKHDIKTLWTSNHYPFMVLCEHPGVKKPTGTCPPGYDLKEGNWCVLPLHFQDPIRLQYEYSNLRNTCARSGAHLPMIKSQEQNELINRIANSYDAISGKEIDLVLDLVCNFSKFVWRDGSPVTYVPPGSSSLDFDCMLHPLNNEISSVQSDRWLGIRTDSTIPLTVLCMVPATP